MEKSREATDLANIRAAYAELMTNAIEGNTIASDIDRGVYKVKATSGSAGSINYQAVVTLKQKKSNWQSNVESVGGFDIKTNLTGVDDGKYVWIQFGQNDEKPNMKVDASGTSAPSFS